MTGPCTRARKLAYRDTGKGLGGHYLFEFELVHSITGKVLGRTGYYYRAADAAPLDLDLD